MRFTLSFLAFISTLASVAVCALAHESSSSTLHPRDESVLDNPTSHRATYIDYDGLLSYKLLASPYLSAVTLIFCLSCMLYLLTTTADTFFCPSLQSIVETYNIPPDIAGATFLSFGNGSPDVFSNIAAFASSTPKIGVASILGGGLLLTTVVAASVGLVSQNQLQLSPRRYVRDVLFYFVAVWYFYFVYYRGLVDRIQAIGFLLIYAVYVIIVIFDRPLAAILNSCRIFRLTDQEKCTSPPPSSVVSAEEEDIDFVSADNESIANEGTFLTASFLYRVQQQTLYLYGTPKSNYSERSTFSAPTPRATYPDSFLLPNHNTDTSQFQPFSGRKSASVCQSHFRRKHPCSIWQSVAHSSAHGSQENGWTHFYHHHPPFSSVSEGDEEEIEDKHIDTSTNKFINYIQRYLWRPLRNALTLLRRLTIPLLHSDSWNRNLTLCSPFCSIYFFGTSVLNLNFTQPSFLLSLFIFGGLGMFYIYQTSTVDSPPQGIHAAPYLALAFLMSVTWIMNIADEVVGILKTLGKVLNVSQLVLGVSVLAWGNTISDLISDVAIARDGFPTMAFAGCFGGPLFNLLVGTGTSLTVATFQRGPVSMGKSSVPLVFVGFVYLFVSLLVNLCVVAWHGYRYPVMLCYALYILYASFVCVSIAMLVL